jgi:hypothetical protein
MIESLDFHHLSFIQKLLTGLPNKMGVPRGQEALGMINPISPDT